MWPYLLVFAFSTLLFFVSTKTNNNIIRRFVIIVAIITPCFLTGLRDVQIGTDTQYYLKIYDAACDKSDYEEYLGVNVVGNRQVNDIENGFTVFV